MNSRAAFVHAGVAIAVATVCGCQSAEVRDRAQNGTIRSEWLVTSSEGIGYGIHSIEALSIANGRLQDIVRNQAKDYSAACYLVPTTSGYKVVVCRSNRSPELDKELLHRVDAVLREAEEEAAAVRERIKTKAGPGATDNPDDAQRLREDH